MYIIATQRHKNTVQFKTKCSDLVILPRACGSVGHHWLWDCQPKASGSNVPLISPTGLKLITLEGGRCIWFNIPLGGSRNTAWTGGDLAKNPKCFTAVRRFGAHFTSPWVFLERHQPMVYSSETCSPTAEEINLLAATASEVPDPLNNSPAFSSPGTSCWCLLHRNTGVENCTVFGLHVQTPLLLLHSCYPGSNANYWSWTSPSQENSRTYCLTKSTDYTSMA